MTAKDFLQFLMDITRETGKTYLMLRCSGPDKCTDVDKLNEVYGTYKAILPPDIYRKIFYNEFVFIEMDTDDEACDFAKDYFPKNTSGDPDYFIFTCVVSEGVVCYANDDLGEYFRLPIAQQ